MSAELLTSAAQNALLKTLEEPPEHTIIILATDVKDILLPTILSRCQIIYLPENRDEDLTESLDLLTRLPKMSAGERLAVAESISKNKENLRPRLEPLIKALQKLAQTSDNPGYYLEAGRQVQEAYRTIRHTNTNPRLALEHLFLTVFPLSASGTIRA